LAMLTLSLWGWKLMGKAQPKRPQTCRVGTGGAVKTTGAL